MEKDKQFNWTYGENPTQRFYDTYVGTDYLLVFANIWQPDNWMGMQRGQMVHDKTANDKQRKREKVSMDYPLQMMRRTTVLHSSDPEYMMRKVEFAYQNNVNEVPK